MVLRAVYALTESGAPATLRTLVAVVPAPAARISDTVRILDQAGYLDASRAAGLRLTMQGLAVACARRPRRVEVETKERRRVPRDQHWAGALGPQRPGLRKTAIVA